MKKIVFYTIIAFGFGFMNCHDMDEEEIIYPEIPIYNFTGIVRDFSDGAIIDEVKVILYKDSVAMDTAYTNILGYFEFDNVKFDHINSVFHHTFEKYGYQDRGRFLEFKDKGTLIEVDLFRVLLVEKEIQSPGEFPYGIAWDGQNIWTIDCLSNNLYKHDNDGNVIETFSLPGEIDWPMALAWDGSNFWLSSESEQKVYKLTHDYSSIAFSDTILYEGPKGPASAIDLTFLSDTLVACDVFSDKITFHNKDNTNVKYKTVYRGGVNGELEDPAGIVFTGFNYYLIRRSVELLFTDIDFNIIDVFLLNKKVGTLSQLAFDREYLWCVDHVMGVIYKLKNIYY